MLKPIRLLFINVSKKNSIAILNKLIEKNFYINIVNTANNLEEAESFQYEYGYNLVFIDVSHIEEDVFKYINNFNDTEIIWYLLVDQPSYSFMREALQTGVDDVILNNMIKNESFDYLEKIFPDNKLDEALDVNAKLSMMLSNIRDHQEVDNYNLKNILRENGLYRDGRKYYISIVRIDNIVYWYRLLNVSRKKIEKLFKNYLENNLSENVFVNYSKKHTAVLFFPNDFYSRRDVENVLEKLIGNSDKLSFTMSIGYSKNIVEIDDFLFRYKDIIKIQESKYYISNSCIVNEDNMIKFNRLKNSNKLSNKILTWINKSNFDNAIYFTNQAIRYFKKNNINIEDTKALFYDLIDNKISGYFYDSSIFFDKKMYKLLIKSSDTIEMLSINAKNLVSSLIAYNEQINNYKNREYIIKAEDYILNNINKKISLEEISLYLNISRSYFSRIFKEKTSISFTDYVNKAKIKQAKNILTETDKSINEIAQELGYSNQFYFSRTFKKFEKITPSQYRRLNKKIEED